MINQQALLDLREELLQTVQREIDFCKRKIKFHEEEFKIYYEYLKSLEKKKYNNRNK